MSKFQVAVEYGDPADIRENKLWAVLSYILFFLPLIFCPHSRFGRFHANQSLLLLICNFAASFVARIFRIIPLLSVVFYYLSLLVCLVVIVFSIRGMILAARGKMRTVPFIGEYRILH